MWAIFLRNHLKVIFPVTLRFLCLNSRVNSPILCNVINNMQQPNHIKMLTWPIGLIEKHPHTLYLDTNWPIAKRLHIIVPWELEAGLEPGSVENQIAIVGLNKNSFLCLHFQHLHKNLILKLSKSNSHVGCVFQKAMYLLYNKQLAFEKMDIHTLFYVYGLQTNIFMTQLKTFEYFFQPRSSTSQWRTQRKFGCLTHFSEMKKREDFIISSYQMFTSESFQMEMFSTV
jgi:hypothetical protein